MISGHSQGHGPRAREIEAEPEHPVVRADEVVAAGRDGEGPARAADPGIHDREMHCPRRKESPGRREQEGRAPHVLGRHRVREIDEPRLRIDREEDALDRPDVSVVEPEVGEEGDDAARAAGARSAAARHRSRWITYSAMRPRISRASLPGTRSSAATPAAA